MNSRAGYVRPTPLAGAPLRPLEYFSKYPRELPLPFRSRSTIIYDFCPFVKGFLANCLKNTVTFYPLGLLFVSKCAIIEIYEQNGEILI